MVWKPQPSLPVKVADVVLLTAKINLLLYSQLCPAHACLWKKLSRAGVTQLNKMGKPSGEFSLFLTDVQSVVMLFHITYECLNRDAYNYSNGTSTFQVRPVNHLLALVFVLFFGCFCFEQSLGRNQKRELRLFCWISAQLWTNSPHFSFWSRPHPFHFC